MSVPREPAWTGRADAATGLIITITDANPDELRSLRAWLISEDEFRGRVTIIDEKTAPGTLSGVAWEALSVSIGSGGTVSVLIAGTMAWLRQQYSQRHPASKATVRLRRPDGASIEISATTSSAWSADQIAAQISRLAATLDAAGHREP